MSIPEYSSHWEEKFKSRPWGKYPSEDLVRFIFKNFINIGKTELSVLEIGCGTGANLWFLKKEGLSVSGIDGSKEAIEIASNRLKKEVSNSFSSNLINGDFSSLPWEDQSFDIVIDIFSLYANKIDNIKSTIEESKRVLKKGGYFFTKVWGTKTMGFNTGKKIEPGTFDDIKVGPCADMGLSHFFSKEELEAYFRGFKKLSIQTRLNYNNEDEVFSEELIGEFKKIEEN